MSSSSTSAISTPAQPRTPDPSSPVVRITLPTRPSFSSHRARSFSITPSSPSNEDAPPKSAKGHGRSVSFSAQVDELDCQDEALRLYRIPQRQEVIEEDAIGSALPVSLDSETRIQRYPPKALSLSDKGYHRGPSSAILPFTRTAPSPSWSLGSAGVPSLSAVVPTQARGTRHSISEAPAIATSIWSAGIHTGAGSGWVSPALSSAQIVTKVTRQRGLSIALVKEGKEELLVEVPVSPGLGSSVPLKVGPVKAEENGEMPINLGLGNSVPLKAGAVTAESDTNSMTDSETEGGSLLGPLKTKAGGDLSKRKKIILCRYYHTPGLTCTSRPCRFVHNLETLAATSSTDTPNYQMRSPTKSPDLTMGTFAQAQAAKRAKVLAPEAINLTAVAPGETVVVADVKGAEVVGTAFYMSGGGKGPAGKGKANYKTVPCKDFADGHCPYGDYCSFIQYLQDDQKKVKAYDVCSEGKKPESIEAKSSMTEIEEGDERNEVQPQGAPSRSLKHRKSASTSNLSAWAKSLPKTDLLPFVKWDEEVLEKQKRRLSAFAPPFLQVPLVVDEKGELVSDSPETLQVEIAQEPESVSTSVEPPKASARSKGPPASLQPSLKIDRKDEQNQETMLSPRVMNTERPPVTVAVPKLTEPRKVSAWTKWPPISLKKVSIARNVHPDTPASVLHLAPPQSAFSLFGTESDPATPWYPAVRRQKSEDAAQAAAEFTNPEYSTTEFEVPPPFPSPSEFPPPLYAPSYPWGMPMLPMPMPGSGYESTLPVIPGGLGVIWTPAGWAVQDVAMKHSLRSAEVKAVYRDARRRTPKTYYRTRPCKMFAEGNCPHGEICTYLHEIPPKPTPSASESDTANQTKHTTFKSKQPRPAYTARTQPCKFFNSAAGCLTGEACTFLHILVVPTSVPLVDHPRPWRTRPCRHFQVGRCSLGDACHFAHILNPAYQMKENKLCHHWTRTGRRDLGEKCRFKHESQAGEDNAHGLTEERLASAFEEMRMRKVREEDSDDEDDDVVIIA